MSDPSRSAVSVRSRPGTRIGLTGGIGSGKSTVAKTLAACGAHIVDTDAIARSLSLPGGGAIPALVASFGSVVLDAEGALDRERMRALVFSDTTAKARLEAILHPLIGQEAARQADQAGGAPIVFDVPLLAESLGPRSWRNRVDRVLVVDCETSTQVERVSQRPGWSAEAARRVIEQQASRQQRRRIADAVIFNEGMGLAELELEVRQLWAHWNPT